MSKRELWDHEDIIRKMMNRKLCDKCPPLLPLLHSGAAVLDAGCSAGAMTLEVAEIVDPGKVIGFDVAENAIKEARALASKRMVANIEFIVADTYDLPFEADSFDLTYSLALLVWLRDPVKALVELKRVTRAAGWVAASIGDSGTRVIYPPSPALDKFFAATAHLNEASEDEIYVSFNLGREALRIFKEAGFEDVGMEGYVAKAEQAHAESQYFEDARDQFRGWSDPEGRAKPFQESLLRRGLLTEDDLLRAQREAERWYQDPHAFQMSTTVFAAGRVK